MALTEVATTAEHRPVRKPAPRPRDESRLTRSTRDRIVLGTALALILIAARS
ncbi:hypothetical protein LVY72_23070 [Arthrobacter sp. I2-34]|uniref:Uncharacterized protein n=1 Tax=Arthrobacter hankyongi TaxID=2904801 RepID=A0ABS9LDJ0_9MICC|nr:hypothetical protein [Arthrobacter hankyongi]MCG2624774.1 hypothetical protein [Arthrobacter hankyongi]